MGAYVARASRPGALTLAARAPWGLVAAAAGVAVWLLVDPRTPDLAAQVYRANLWREAGFTVWDSRWYGGHTIPGYSLLFPPLGALVGVRAVGAAAVLVSAALWERIALAMYGRPGRWGAVWFALAALGDVWSGRITFALGVSFALGAVWALMRFHTVAAVGPAAVGLAAVCAAVCAACSPVAGVLLALAALTHALVMRSWRALLTLGVPAAAVAVVMAWWFGEGGWEPFPLRSFLATATVTIGFLAALATLRAAGGLQYVLRANQWLRSDGPGSRWRLLWVGGLAYLAACVACVAVHSPMGANVERYGVLLAGPLLLCEALAHGGRLSAGAATQVGRSSGPAPGGRIPAAAIAALAGIAVWSVWGPVRETVAAAGNRSTSAAYYAPVVRFVAGVEASRGEPVRVEVPFTRSHWEAAWLARRVMLARGWEKQLDERYNGVLLAKRVTAAGYWHWLAAEAVSYVALPDAPLDPSSAGEGRLIEAGLPYLREVRHVRHWRIYEVRHPTPLARGPGMLSGVGHDWFSLRARAAGRFVVRMRYTRYFTVVAGVGCVASGPGGFTEVSVARPGTVRVAARFSLARALGASGRSCRG